MTNMPQMAPLMWDLIMISILFFFFFLFVFFYYSNTKNYKNFNLKKVNIMNYKW